MICRSNIGKAIDDGWVITFPQGTTTPFKPPFKLSKGITPSTSKPRSVNSSEVCSEVQSVFINCFSQLYEIRIVSYFKNANIRIKVVK